MIKEGDICIVVNPRGDMPPFMRKHIGKEVIVEEVCNDVLVSIILFGGAQVWHVRGLPKDANHVAEHWLQKKPPAPEKSSWGAVEKATGWCPPLKEKV